MCFSQQEKGSSSTPILPGLPDDVSKHCLALVPRSRLPTIGSVCKRWRSFIKSKEFIAVRKLAGVLEEWLYVLTLHPDGKHTHWELLGHKHHPLPPMPGPAKAGFAVVVLNAKLMVIAGYSLADASISSDLYQYDSCLSRFVLVPLIIQTTNHQVCLLNKQYYLFQLDQIG